MRCRDKLWSHILTFNKFLITISYWFISSTIFCKWTFLVRYSNTQILKYWIKIQITSRRIYMFTAKVPISSVQIILLKVNHNLTILCCCLLSSTSISNYPSPIHQRKLGVFEMSILYHFTCLPSKNICR